MRTATERRVVKWIATACAAMAVVVLASFHIVPTELLPPIPVLGLLGGLGLAGGSMAPALWVADLNDD
jgi:hypothetical protein